MEGPEGLAYTYIYDKEGHVTEVRDALGGRVELVYDEVGQLIQETNQLGDSRSYTYTLLGNIESVTDEAGRVTRYAYLPGGQLQSVIHSDGTTESYTYDGNGNVKSYTNASGFTLSYFYDRLDRIIRIEDSEGERKEYTYDAVGNVTSMTDALGNCTRYEYSLTGQLTKVIDPLGNETEYSYDACDRLTEIRQYGEDGSLKEGTDTSGMDAELLEAEKRNARNRVCHVTKYQRNLLGQVETIMDALGLQEHYSYDPKGQLIEKLDKEGYLTKYGYTGQGDVSHIQYADGREVKYSYNPLRHLQEMEDWLGITKIATDPLGRAQDVQYPDGKNVSYTYGKVGERTSITYPDGKTIYYGFDEQVRLSELRDGDSVITYGYDETGRLAQKHFPNGMHTDYRYDSKGQIQELIHADREGILDRYTYQYDLLGNKTGIEKQRRGLEEESGSYQYGYDPLGRLNEVIKDSNPLRNYSYDVFGNRTRLTERGKTTTYAYNNVNQLLSRVDAGVEETYTYDKRGNLSQITANGQIKNQYLYGALNRLEQAVNGKGKAARYQYNGLGHRVGKEIGVDNVQLINKELDPVKRLQSQTISPEKQVQYTIDLTREYHNLLLKEEDNHAQTFLWDGNVAGMLEDEKGFVSYYTQDELGSPLRLAGKDGNLSDSYGYDEFGLDLYGNQGIVQPFGFTGYQKDDITGTYFAQAREYNTLLGRFNEEDLVKGDIVLPKTQNSYKYALNQPLRYIDPTGLLEESSGKDENELRIAWEKYCEQVVENVSEPVNWALWSIDGAFSGIEVYNQISKHIPRFITNSNNRNLVNISDSINYHGGRGGVRRISKSNLLARNDELGRAYRTNRNLNRISKGLIVLNAGVSFVSEYNSNPNLPVKEKVVNSTVEATWSVGSGVAIGAAVGSIVPGAGTIAGAAIGFVAGTIGSVIIDGVVRAKWFENGSKSIMDYAKQGANWAVDKVSEGLNSIGEAFSGIGDLVFG